MQTVQSIVEIIGAVSMICGALSHIIPGKAGRLLGEIGLDIAGFLKERKQ